MKEQTIDQLIAFLERENAKEKFLRNIIAEVLNYYQDKYVPWAVFKWDRTPEGHDYWDKLSKKWEEQIDDKPE